MGVEIERKFLLANDHWRREVKSQQAMIQGYLNSNPNRTVRVRIVGEKAVITVKGMTKGATRAEFEYEIPKAEGVSLIELCEKPIIAKIRYEVEANDLLWEIDEFNGDNQGLIVAEVELEDENQVIELPDWIGEEVTHDKRYFNAALINHPYKDW